MRLVHNYELQIHIEVAYVWKYTSNVPGHVYEITDKPKPTDYRDLSTMREVRDSVPYQYDNQAMVAKHL